MIEFFMAAMNAASRVPAARSGPSRRAPAAGDPFAAVIAAPVFAHQLIARRGERVAVPSDA